MISSKIKKEISEIKQLLDSEKAVLKRLQDAKNRAIELIEEGYPIEGYFLADSYGNRAWRGDIEVQTLYTVFKKFIPKKSLYTETKLLSPAKLEKYFLEFPDAVEKLSDFTDRKYKGKILKSQ